MTENVIVLAMLSVYRIKPGIRRTLAASDECCLEAESGSISMPWVTNFFLRNVTQFSLSVHLNMGYFPPALG